MFEAPMNRLHPLAAQAVDTLAAQMLPSEPPSVRLGAARTWPNWAFIVTTPRPSCGSSGKSRRSSAFRARGNRSARLAIGCTGTGTRVYAIPGYYRSDPEGDAAIMVARGIKREQIGNHADPRDTSQMMAIDPTMVR